MRQIVLVGMTLMASVCHAQIDSTRVKKFDQYLGIQANELLRQLFNLSNNSSAVVNPYLINYSLNSSRSGWGLNVGVGYTIDNLDQSDPNTTHKSESTNFSFRVEVERKISITKKWMLSYGFDLLSDKRKGTTTNKFQSQFNTSESDTDFSIKDSGFGPRFTLNYFVTPKIILGTEMSYYYKAINNSQKVTNIDTSITVDPNTGRQVSSTNTSTNDTSQTLKQLHFAVPAILFVILKF